MIIGSVDKTAETQGFSFLAPKKSLCYNQRIMQKERVFRIMSNAISKDFRLFSLLKFAFPTMVMMVFMSLYTIVDRKSVV